MRWMFLYSSQKEAEDSSFLSNCSDAVFEFLQIFAMCNTSRLWRFQTLAPLVCHVREGSRNYIIRFKSQNIVEWCGEGDAVLSINPAIDSYINDQCLTCSLITPLICVFSDWSGGKWVSERRNASLQDQEEVPTRIREKVITSLLLSCKSGWKTFILICATLMLLQISGRDPPSHSHHPGPC